MKPCASCKNPKACAAAGKCMAAKPAPATKGVPAAQRKTGRFYMKRVD